MVGSVCVGLFLPITDAKNVRTGIIYLKTLKTLIQKVDNVMFTSQINYILRRRK